MSDVARQKREVHFSISSAAGFGIIDKIFYTFDEPFWEPGTKYIVLTKSLPDAKEPVR